MGFYPQHGMEEVNGSIRFRSTKFLPFNHLDILNGNLGCEVDRLFS